MADATDTLKKDSAAKIEGNLLAGKYKTAEDLAAAYTELEKKIGQMGTETAAQRAELEQVRAQAAQFQQGHEWATTYGQQLVQAHQQLQAQVQQLQNGRPNGGQTNGQDPLAWFTQPEREALVRYIAPLMQQHMVQPYIQQWAQQQALPAIQKMIADTRDSLAAQQKAALSLTWDALKTIAPADRMEAIQRRQQSMLKYSDPKAYDPTKFADEDVERDKELAAHRERVAELEKKLTERENAGPPSSRANGVSMFKKDGERPAPKTREERIQTVVDKVREQAGPEQFREAFPAAT